MLGTAVIVFRETLEAALIVTIVLAATRGVARRGA
jgi:high-affinity iron transporter